VAAQSSAEVPLDTILADGVRGAPDVAAFASVEPKKLAVMVWHYHDDDVAGPDAAVHLAVSGLPAAARQAAITHYRIDEHHSNAYAAWKRMGSPIAPTREQYAELETASHLAPLAEGPRSASVTNGALTLTFALPRQAVSLVTIEWE
jgi:xylan 1,4-beta-xylosidase